MNSHSSHDHEPAAARSGCPINVPRTLPTDGRPLAPSQMLLTWQAEAPATPLDYPDGYRGWIVTRQAVARELLNDPRFSQRPLRLPGPHTEIGFGEIDDLATEAVVVGDILALDDPAHSRLRRLVTSQFSVRAARARREMIAGIVREQLDHLRAQGSPADLSEHFALPFAARVHCEVLGIPGHLSGRFVDLFEGESTTQQKFDFLREVIAYRRVEPGNDTVSELIAADMTEAEREGVVFILLGAGRDAIAYTIATSMTALLTHPEQLAKLRENPELMSSAMEEFMRFGPMFVTLFPRTAIEDVELEGISINAGDTVSVSPVAANRDDLAFEHPHDFDISRDASGHLGFGYGLHACVGQQLARVEITEAIRELVAEFPQLRLIHAEQLEPMPFAHPVATYEAGAVVVAWE